MSVKRPLVVLGDALLDRDVDGTAQRLAPDAPVPVVDQDADRARPGGAALAAALAAADGHDVVLVSALGDDDAGEELRALIEAAGVELVDLGLDGTTPEKIRVRAGGQSLLRLDRGGGTPRRGAPPAAALSAIAGARGVLVADYGRGVASVRGLRKALTDLPARTPVVWDPHPRGVRPTPGVRLGVPSRSEAGALSGTDVGALPGVTTAARALVERWQAANVVVTLGDAGALLVGAGGPPLVVPARKVAAGDTCGAGDRFAATACALLADGALPSEAVVGAVEAAARFVAAGGAGAVRVGEGAGLPGVAAASGEAADGTGLADAQRLVEAVRAAGGTVVATGGCFDLLHAGHVATLEAARALGDCLVVVLNADVSVRRLKGPQRPLVPEHERRAVLSALACVDAVVLFEQDTPVEVLSALRPHLFAKGGDYALDDLPETQVLAGWGGQVVVLPYLEGRSTSRLVEKARS